MKNETCTNHHGLLSSLIFCFEIFLRDPSAWGEGRSLPKSYIYHAKPQILQRNRKVHRSNCLDANFHHISDISLNALRRRNYNICEFFRRKIERIVVWIKLILSTPNFTHNADNASRFW